MKNKKCTTCNQIFDISKFSKNKWSKDGFHHQCKQCKRLAQQKYSRTKKGLIANIYKHQKETSKKRNYEQPSYTLDELKEWCYQQDIFHKLYDEWVKSGYLKSKIPSIDRIDDYKTYSFDNIQILDWNKNHNKYSNDKFIGKTTKQTKKIKQIKDDKVINVFFSISEASRQTNIHINNISSVLLHKTKTAGGFKWEYAE